MPSTDELVDERIRVVLGATRPGLTELAEVTATVRARAGGRLRRRRAVAGVAAVACVAALTVVVSLDGGRPALVTDATGPAATTAEGPRYGWDPLTPLLDAPLAPVPDTVITTIDDQSVVAAVTSDGQLQLILRNEIGAGSVSGDQMYASALFLSSSTPADPVAPEYWMGITRAEVTRIDVSVDGARRASVPTIRHEAFPTLRFFVVALPDRPSESAQAPPKIVTVAAYDASGHLLTDSDHIGRSAAEFQAAMDVRAGVEWVTADIVGVLHHELGDTWLVVRAHTCGGEGRTNLGWAGRGLEVSVTVKRPIGTGECTSGDTADLTIGLEEPLGSTAIIDARSGEAIPWLPDGS